MPAFEAYVLRAPLFRPAEKAPPRWWILATEERPSRGLQVPDFVAGFWAEDLLHARRALVAIIADYSR